MNTEPQLYAKPEQLCFFRVAMRLISLSFGILAASLFLSACSKTGDDSAQQSAFSVTPQDFIGFADIRTNNGASNAYVIHLNFTKAKAEEFRAYTRAHLNQSAQFVIGSRIVKGPLIGSEISDGQVDLTFLSLSEANAVADSLAKRMRMVTGGGKIGNDTPPSISTGP